MNLFALDPKKIMRRLVHENDLYFVIGALEDVLLDILDENDYRDLNLDAEFAEAYALRAVTILRAANQKINGPIHVGRKRGHVGVRRIDK